MNKKFLQYFIISIIIFSLIIIVIFQTKEGKQQVISKREQQEYMKNLTVTHFNENGDIKDKINATYWAYMPSKGCSVLTKPTMLLNKPNGAKWLLEAKEGIAYHKTIDTKIAKLDLSNQVIIERAKINNFTPVIIQTEQLSYFLDNGFVETDKFVSMKKPEVQITGVGLNGYLNKNWVELLHDVTTCYHSN